MSDAMLEYLKSIDEKAGRIETKLDAQETRVRSLEESRANQRGVMAAGGTMVTFLSGFVSWLFHK